MFLFALQGSIYPSYDESAGNFQDLGFSASISHYVASPSYLSLAFSAQPYAPRAASSAATWSGLGPGKVCLPNGKGNKQVFKRGIQVVLAPKEGFSP